MIPRDKIMHAIAGVIGASTVLFIGWALDWKFAASAIVAGFVVVFVGLAKELWDQFHPKIHTADIWDASATALGGIATIAVTSLVRWLLVFVCAFGLAACGSRVHQAQAAANTVITGPAAHAPDNKEDAKVENADAKVDRLTGELAAAKSEAATARKQRDEAELAWLHRLILWLSGICVLGILGFTVAFCFTRVKTFAIAAASFIGGLIALQITSFALAHIAWIIGGVIVASIVALVGVLLHNRAKTRALADGLHFGEVVSELATKYGLEAPMILAKQDAAKRQVASGTKLMIESALAKVSSGHG